MNYVKNLGRSSLYEILRSFHYDNRPKKFKDPIPTKMEIANQPIEIDDDNLIEVNCGEQAESETSTIQNQKKEKKKVVCNHSN